MAENQQARHQRVMQKQKSRVDAAVERAQIERGVLILLTGPGKGKSTSAFGMVMRALGYGYKVGIVQFIKGDILSGEELYLRAQHPDVDFYQMGTGFTWETQDRARDIAAALQSWSHAERMLSDDSYHLVVLDELTYMLSFEYLDEKCVIDVLSRRPPQQSVVITGRGGGKALVELADTVSRIQDAKHAFQAGIKARRGVDY